MSIEQPEPAGLRIDGLAGLTRKADQGRTAGEVLAVLGHLYANRTTGFGLDLLGVFSPVYMITGLMVTAEFPDARLAFFLNTSIALAGLMLVFAGWSSFSRRDYQQRLEREVTFELLLSQLQDSATELGRIRRWIPLPFCWFFHRHVPITVKDQVSLLARNYDWLLGEPAPLVRVHWVAYALLTVAAVPYGLALFYSHPAVEFTLFAKAHLVLILSVFILVTAALSLLQNHGLLCEGIRIEVMHDLLAPYLESIAESGQAAEAGLRIQAKELTRTDEWRQHSALESSATGQSPDLVLQWVAERDSEEEAAPLMAWHEWIIVLTGLSAGAGYVLIRMSGLAPEWLHRPVNLLLAVFTFFFTTRIACRHVDAVPVARANHWIFATIPVWITLLAYGYIGPLKSQGGNPWLINILFAAGVVGACALLASALLGVDREKLVEFCAGLACGLLLVFGVIGLFSMGLGELGY